MGINYEPASVATKKNRNSMIYRKKCSEERWTLSELTVISHGRKYRSVVVAERPKNMNSDIFELAINIYRSEAIQAIYLYKLLRHHIKKSSESKRNCTQHAYIYSLHTYIHIYSSIYIIHIKQQNIHTPYFFYCRILSCRERERMSNFMFHVICFNFLLHNVLCTLSAFTLGVTQ